MRNLIKLIVVVAIMIASIQAKAEEPVTYFGLGIGQGRVTHKQAGIDANFTNIPSSASIEDSNFGLHVLLGMWFDKYLGMEASYQDIPVYSAKTATSQMGLYGIQNASVFVTTRKNIFNQEFFAKGGLSFWSICTESSCGTELESGQSLAYGAGVNINLYDSNERMMRLEWEHTAVDSIYINSLDVISLSIVFSFGAN